MKSFKEFLNEMPVLGTGLKKDSTIHNDYEKEVHKNEHNEAIKDGRSIKIGKVGDMHLYKEQQPPLTKDSDTTSIYRLVHPKTKNVHMSLVGDENNGALYIHKVGKHIKDNTPKAEDFYLSIAHNDKGLNEINSDAVLSPGGLNIWKRIVEKGNRIGHTFSHKGKNIGIKGVKTNDEFTPFKMKIKR